jgi:hypothetical protein
MGDFNPLGFINKIFVAFAIAIVVIIAYFITQSNTNVLLTSGAMNITAWNPMVAQIPTVILPLTILGAGLFLVYVVFFKPKLPDNPFYTQAKQQYSAQQRLQRDIQRQQARRKPRNTMRPM